MKYTIIEATKSVDSLRNEIDYIIDNYLSKDDADEILYDVLRVHYSSKSRAGKLKLPKDENELISVLTKFKKQLIDDVCENRGANCYDYLDKLAPYVDKGEI